MLIAVGVCNKIRDKPTNTTLGKTWKFGLSSFRLVLEKVSWDKLLTFLEVPGRPVAIELLQVDASDLPSHLNNNSFDRIEVCVS